MVRLSDNGWITSELFMAWAENFVQQLPKDDLLPHVLFLDGHGSHVYNLDFINLMKRNNVNYRPVIKRTNRVNLSMGAFIMFCSGSLLVM